MTEEVSRLSLAVDSTQVKQASADLDKFAAAGAKAETAASGVEKGTRGLGSAMAGVAAGSKGATTAATGFAAAQKQTNDALAKAQQQAKLTAFQTQQLGFQLHDFFVQVAAGGNPLQAFVQQGSQLSGTFGGAGNALRALGTVFTATRLAIGGVVGAAAGLILAFERGAQQSIELQRAIILTGNAAGITEGQFNSLAEAVANSTNTTIGSARETLQSLVASGRFSGEALAAAAKGVELLAKTTGESREDIIRDFVRAADGPAKFAEQTNRSLNFLTAKQLDYIKTLEDQGRTQEALGVTFEALNKRTGEAAQKVGLLEKAWQGVKNAVSGAADALLGIGRDKTAEERIAQLRQELDRASNNPNFTFAQRQAGPVLPALSDQQRAAKEAEIAALKASLDVKRAVAAQDAQDAQRNQAAIAFDKLKEQTLTRQARLAKELADANALADRAGATTAERAAVLAGIREKFASLDSDVNAVAKARLQADLAAIEQALRDRNDAVRNAQTVFNALRQAGQLDDAEAFAAQRAQVQLQAQFEVQALQDRIARLREAQFVGKDAARLQIENDKEIATAQAEIVRVRGAAAAQDEALTIQQEANARRRIAAQEQERSALQQAFEATARGFDLEASLFGRGDEFAQAARQRAQIVEQFTQQIARAQAEIAVKRTAGTATADDERDFEVRIQLLQSFLDRSLSAWDAYYAKLKQDQASALSGASRALEDYAEASRNSNRLVFDTFNRGLQTAEDALVGFFTTGKLGWKSLADFAVAEIVRIAVKQQILGPLAALASGGGGTAGNNPSAFVNTGSLLAQLFGSFFGGGRATGGSVQSGGVYEINERGGPGEILNVGSRQFLLAAQSGTVASSAGQGGKSITQNITVNVPQGTSSETADQLGARMARYLAFSSAANN